MRLGIGLTTPRPPEGLGVLSPSKIFGSHLTGMWADTITVVSSKVTQWTDLSGNNRHWSTPSLIPTRNINAVTNAGGLIKIQTSVNHGFATGDPVTIASVGGTTEANGNWTITVTAANQFTLNGSTFVHTYTSGGTAADTNTHQPTKSAAALNGHDVLTLTPSSAGNVPNGPQYLTTSAGDSQFISASAYYAYWLANVTSIQSNFSPFSGTNEEIWTIAGADFSAGLALKTANNLLAWNFGGNVDPTNGETASTTLTTGVWALYTERHVGGKVGVRVNNGSWVETNSSDTFLSGAILNLGANFSNQMGMTGQIGFGAFVNAAATADQDRAMLDYLRWYGAIAL